MLLSLIFVKVKNLRKEELSGIAHSTSDKGTDEVSLDSGREGGHHLTSRGKPSH